MPDRRPTPRPTRDELQALGETLGMHLRGSELEELLFLSHRFAGGLDFLESLPEPERAKPPERDHHPPAPGENKLGAWVHRTSVRERDEGPLAGRTVVLKDNIALAGVPLSGGAAFLRGYVPEEDAAVARRVLDAGAEIVGKAACEYLSLSAGSHTSETGPVHNPHHPEHTTGGSSSGCAALVAAREVDLAIGGDQGGSIRLPASFCGIVGMKPTHGLVPYTGILSIDAHVDHTGPMTATVADNALLLEVLAGPDGVDPRQRNVRVGAYAEAARQDARAMKVGVLEEGFQQGTDPDVESAVRAAANALGAEGVQVDRVSVAEHLQISAVILPLLVLGVWDLVRSGGFASHASQPAPFGLAEAWEGWREHADAMPPNVKMMLLDAALADTSGRRSVYAKALRLAAAARRLYDRVLSDCDALLMPTTPCTAPRLPAPDASIRELIAASSRGITNTSQFDVTGHPAISVPCGSDAAGLPIGCMLVGRHFEEAALYRLASAVEAQRRES